MAGAGGKDIVIRADAGAEMGTGHLMRSLALGEAWKDSGGHVVFITACQSEGLLQRLEEEGFEMHVLSQSHPESSDWECTKRILTEHPRAWAVLDGYHFDESYQVQIKEGGHRLLVIDDMAHLRHYYADIILNQNLHAGQLNYDFESYGRLLLGAKYVLLRREFLAWKSYKRDIPDVARRILVTIGGGDARNHTLKMMQAIQRLAAVPGVEAAVVVGASNPHRSALEEAAAQSRVPIHMVRNVRGMPELMAWADIAVSSGGTTCWELAFMGLPNIILAVVENQFANAENLHAVGVAINIKWQENVTESDIQGAVIRLLQGTEMRREISTRGQKLIDGIGCKRVLEEMQCS